MSSPWVGKDFAAWYVAESTEGTTPTSPTWLPLAQHTKVDPKYPPNLLKIRQSGSVDLAKLALGVYDPQVQLDYYPADSTFLRTYLSTDSTFSLIIAPSGAATEWLLYKGCKVQQTNAKAQVYPTTMPFSVTHRIWSKAVTIQATDPSPGTPSYTAFGTGALNWSDVTLKKATVLQTDWHSFEFVVSNSLKRLPNPADGTTRTIKRLVRELTGTIVRDFSDIVEYTDIVTPNNFNLTLTMDSSHTIQFNNSQWEDFNPPVDLEDLINKSVPFRGLTLTTS